MLAYPAIKVEGSNPRISRKRSCTINKKLRGELIIHKNQKIQTSQNKQRDLWKKEGKEKRDIKMDAERMSVNKNDAKKPFVAKVSDNHSSESIHPRAYTPTHKSINWHILPHAMTSYAKPLYINLESQQLFKNREDLMSDSTWIKIAYPIWNSILDLFKSRNTPPCSLWSSYSGSNSMLRTMSWW